jgi:tetratricopeptide (TPR) repeat protein
MTLRATPIPAILADSPLVGRVDDLEFLLAQWRRVGATSRSALVLLTGDPGIGKSRLLDELAARVDGESLVVRSTYPPYGGYGGVRVGGDLVTQLGPSDDPAVQKKVRTLLGELDTSMTGMDSATLRAEQLWALRRLAEDRSKKQSVVVLIEDAHMASTSIDLLTSFVARISDLPILVVLAGRPEGKWLTSFATANTLRLGPLSLEDSRKLARQWGANVASEDRLLRWTGGNPLFLREVLAFDRQNPDATDQRRLPISLRSVLAARLDGLAPAERSALQDFAVIGDTATVEQLVALGGAPSSEGIAGLTNAGLVRHRPDGTLRITEPLLREVAYSTLAKATRVERHLRMAELSVRSDDRARHLARAQAMAPDDGPLKVRAADALAFAGAAALDVSRRNEGITMLRQALELGYRKPAALLRLADALNDGDHQSALEVLALLPEASGDARVDAERVLVRANALVDIDSEEAWRGFDDAAQRWHALGDRIKEGWSHSNKGVALFMHGRIADSDSELVRALQLFANENYRTGEQATLSFRALVRPDHPDVETWLHESLAYAIELGDRSRHLSVLGSLQWHHVLRSRLGGPAEVAAARTWIDETIDLASELGWTNFLVQGHCLRANLARMEGDFALAEAQVAAAREFEPIESVGERALLEAISASLVPGTAFRLFDDADPFSSVAAVIQMESALFEGRFNEIIEQGLIPTRANLGPRQAGVGFLPAAAGLLLTGNLASASATAQQLLDSAPGVNALSLLGAKAVLAECAFHLDVASESASTSASAQTAVAALPCGSDRPGGLVGSLILRAQGLAGDHSALDELRDFALFVRAPGLLAGIEALAL